MRRFFGSRLLVHKGIKTAKLSILFTWILEVKLAEFHFFNYSKTIEIINVIFLIIPSHGIEIVRKLETFF